MSAKIASPIRILGISAYYHDSAATLVIDGKVVSAAQEERFTRKKNDSSFPKYAIKYVLDESGISISDLDTIVFYDKPFLKFERLLETYHTFAPFGFKSFIMSMPIWIKEKLFMRGNIWKGLEEVTGEKIINRPPLIFSEHHLSHAASAFYPSPYLNSAILTVDGVGEWATTTICKGEGKNISILKEMRFPHSLGLLYSAFTYYCGFKVNSDEYKLMGLAPYGHKESNRVKEFKEKIKTFLVSIKDDGSIALNMSYFKFATGGRTCDDKKWQILFGITPRLPNSLLTQEYSDMALAIQEVAEEIMVLLAKTAKKITNSDYLVLAGGVALNCVANQKIRELKIFKDIWVQPSAGDAGGALGAAFVGYHIWNGMERIVDNKKTDGMNGAYLGPEFSDNDVIRTINKYSAKYKKYDNFSDLTKDVAEFLSNGKVIGWMQGRMEWGPRSLGNRSILADPRNPDMQKKLNLKVKHREGFRPFAPSVLIEDVSEYFETNIPSPYMLFTVPVLKSRRKPLAPEKLSLFERLYTPRSDFPSVTHLDYSSRIQTVSKLTNEKYWNLINDFKKLTGYAMVINTSFNINDKPIVCNPEDAYKCFISTEIDYLVIGNFLFRKA